MPVRPVKHWWQLRTCARCTFCATCRVRALQRNHSEVDLKAGEGASWGIKLFCKIATAQIKPVLSNPNFGLQALLYCGVRGHGIFLWQEWIYLPASAGRELWSPRHKFLVLHSLGCLVKEQPCWDWHHPSIRAHGPSDIRNLWIFVPNPSIYQSSLHDSKNLL